MVGGVVGVAVSQGSAAQEPGLPPGEPCAVPGEESLAAAASAERDDNFAYQDWLANSEAQDAVSKINDELDSQFGGDEFGDDRLSDGLIGIAVDHYAQEYVVVVDADLVGEHALEERLSDVAEAAKRASGGALTVRVQDSCYSAADLLKARDVLETRAWHPDVEKASYDFGLDAWTSTYWANFAEADSDVANSLKKELGDLVTITIGSVATREEGGRLHDNQPHWGGSGIGSSQGSYGCTSGFTARMPNGNVGAVTAGHCWNNDTNVYSGGNFYGRTDGRHDFPRFDMSRIQPEGQNHNRRIHVDPCCPVVRNVVEAGNPDVGSFICASGMSTRAVCGIEVTTLDRTICDAAGCTPDLIRAAKTGENIHAPGDSGAPYYNRWDDNNAAIRGMHVAGNLGAPGPNDVIFGHRVTTIRQHLNVNGIEQ